MFFSWRKKKKLEAEAKMKEQQSIQEERLKKLQSEADAYSANVEAFHKICDMVRSQPKESQIVVVQRKNFFKDKSYRNWFYWQLAYEMYHIYKATGQRWMSDYEDSLYAFYAPTRLTTEFRTALKNFSKEGCRIQRIRYYHFNN